jgi:hypothetical protein
MTTLLYLTGVFVAVYVGRITGLALAEWIYR